MAWSPYAAAQSDAPSLTPPKITTTETVPYPDDARGDSVVVLELLIDTSGAVGEVKVIDGVEPFAAAART
ncbi:MAG TPA: hypothetical protein VNO21_17445, partial [Polyangiaceae bacterium]|nr:hypothetical protein [Polyangiaceae bacterium]